jgi:integrase
MPKILLTQRIVEDYSCPQGKKKIDLFDQKISGLTLEIRCSGGRTYYLRHKNKRGVTKLLKLGIPSDLSLGQARQLAQEKRTMIALGADPSEQKAALKQVPTFAQFIDEQYLPFVKTYKASWSTDVSQLKNHLLPRFANRYMDQITRQDIVKMHFERKATGAAGSANRLLIMMRYMFNLAIRWEVAGIKANPCAGVPLLEENNKMERYLSVEEGQRLYQAVCNSDNLMLKHIVSMLILTGARKREVLDAKWQDFDIERSTWRIPVTKSGKARHVPLSDGALTVLSSVPVNQYTPYVFANPATNKPFISIYCAWNTARKQAGLADVRMHDLRHSFASLLINSGRTLYEVQHILGHTQVKTTQRYAHLSQDTLLDAANAATRAMGAVMLPVVRPAALTHISV